MLPKALSALSLENDKYEGASFDDLFKATSDSQQQSYSIIIANISNATILISDPMHMLVVKGDPNTKETVKAFCMLTSRAAFKTSVKRYLVLIPFSAYNFK